MTGWAASTDIESLVRRARALWERAHIDTGSHRVEVYVKHAQRRRVGRERASDELRVSDAIESGSALRWIAVSDRRLLHAAIAGMDGDEFARAIGAAGHAHSDLGTLAGIDDDVPPERLDLETSGADFDEEAVRAGLRREPRVEWVELGVTAEVLVGPAGWTAIRTRARSSALLCGTSRLVARRGFGVLEAIGEPTDPAAAGNGRLALSPSAAAGIVARLVQAIHGADPALGQGVGPAWDVIDDPLAPAGLAGGTFDDAGFPTHATPLARGERVLSGIEGPGSYWRRSFRDPPRSLPSTLVVGGGASGTRDRDEPILDECRVLPLGRGEWVLELPGRRPKHVRTHAEALLRGCVGTLGAPETTADGVITPGLVFEGIARR